MKISGHLMCNKAGGSRCWRHASAAVTKGAGSIRSKVCTLVNRLFGNPQYFYSKVNRCNGLQIDVGILKI